MRRWLRRVAETAETAETPVTRSVAPLPRPQPEVSAVSATPLPRPHPPLDEWPARLRSCHVEGANMAAAADVLETLLRDGVVSQALALGWDPLELIGMWRHRPHDHPYYAGLLFSVRHGDRVRSVSAVGCIIQVATKNVRHIWRRAPATGRLGRPQLISAPLLEVAREGRPSPLSAAEGVAKCDARSFRRR